MQEYNPAANRRLAALRATAAFAMLGAIIAGLLGHHGDDVQWACIVGGSFVGSMQNGRN